MRTCRSGRIHVTLEMQVRDIAAVEGKIYCIDPLSFPRRSFTMMGKELQIPAFAAVLVAFSCLLVPVFAASTSGGGFNTPGNVLISDQFNNRIIEVNPSNNQIVWSFGTNNTSDGVPGPGAIIGSNWAERIGQGQTLIAGTGIPAGVDPQIPNGSADNRVIIVNQAGVIVWQYGIAGQSGSGPGLLDVPVAAIELPNGDILITDQGNNRIIEVSRNKQIVWQYGPSSGPGALNSPNSAELLANGNILIADEGNNRVIEINRAGTIVWSYDTGIQAAAFASRLPNGNTLITDSGNARIVEVSPRKVVVSEYFTNAVNGSNPDPLPTNAVKLKNGNMMIADQFNDRVINVNAAQQVVWQYGVTNVSGNDPGFLNGPYTGFVIGDYTGQTVPPIIPAASGATLPMVSSGGIDHRIYGY